MKRKYNFSTRCHGMLERKKSICLLFRSKNLLRILQVRYCFNAKKWEESQSQKGWNIYWDFYHYAAFFVNLNINCIIFMNFISQHCICVELVLLFFCAYFKLKSCVMQLLFWFHLNNEYIWSLLAATITFHSLLYHKDNFVHKELLMTICVLSDSISNLWILWSKKKYLL